MLRTWSFWKTFFIAYAALVAGVWGFVEAYSYFGSDSLKQLLGSYWWIDYYVIPLLIAILLAAWIRSGKGGEIESFDQHNRRVMLNHVEDFWVKGVLEKSLHGAALLDLDIKRESTNETLPAGKSMLEIFEEVGAGRSLLILGAPGSGKTTMLLELARQFINLARNNENEPVPVVFNLSSWTEKQTLADWLVDQLNIVYSVPKKTALNWISENKMLLLLDGLDEVRQESRAKCVEAINQFKTEYELSTLVVCSRIEEYQTADTKLSFEGAIALQPLAAKQVHEYFDRFEKKLVGAKQLLQQDEALRELVETPLMLSIMTLAYEDKDSDDLASSKNIEEQRKHLFTTYINRMFERSNRTIIPAFTKTQTLYYLSWLARKLIQHNLVTYQIEAMQPSWLDTEKQKRSYKWVIGLSVGLSVGVLVGLIFGLIGGLSVGTPGGLVFGLLGGLIFGLMGGLSIGLMGGLSSGLMGELSGVQIAEINYPGQRIKQTLYGSVIKGLISGLSVALISRLMGGLSLGIIFGLIGGLGVGLSVGLIDGLDALLQHYTLWNILTKKGYLPRQLIPFLEQAVGLIFLRRVGGGYIFVHRLLMEHFAEMDVKQQ